MSAEGGRSVAELARDALALVQVAEELVLKEPATLVTIALVDARCALTRVVRELERPERTGRGRRVEYRV